MPVQDCPDCVADGLVEIIAFDQNRKEGSNGACSEVPCPLADFWQQRKHRRRIAFLSRRFARRKPNFALGHREPRDRIHDEQYTFFAIAEVLRDGKRDERRANPQGGGHIRGSDHHNRTRQPFGTELFFEKLANLSVALTDQRDHVHISGAMPRHGAEQSALADAAASEDADSLAFAARKQAVNSSDAGRQPLLDVFPSSGPGGLAFRS